MSDSLKNIIGLAYPVNALKKDLWDVIKKSRTPPVYAIIKLLKKKVISNKSKIQVTYSNMQVMRW